MGENSYSVELCGGTHVTRTGDIGFFTITSQSSVASGIRRVEAIAGMQALNYIKKLKEVNFSIQNLLNVSSDDIHDKVKSLIDENKALKSKGTKSTKREIVFSESFEINDWKLTIQQVQLDDNKDLRFLADEQKNTNKRVCVVIFSEQNNKIAFVCGVTKNLTDALSAKDIVSVISEKIGGKGGGRPDFAQGAGESKNIKDFVTSIQDTVKSLAK